MIDVSVVSPTYGRHRYIPFLLRQFAKQTFDPDRRELIVLDDSPEPYPFDDVRHKNVTYTHDNSRRYMIWEKRNLLNGMCRGHTIVCMDDDDIYFPERIAHALEVLDAHPKVLLAGCSSLYIYDMRQRNTFLFRSRHSKHILNGSFAYRKELLKTNQYKSNSGNNFNEERSFTHQFRTRAVPLDIAKTTVCVSHDCNTVPKDSFCRSESETPMSALNLDPVDLGLLHTASPVLYWINMDGATERRAHMESQLKDFKLHRRIASIDTFGNAVKANKATTAAEASCMASHLKALDAFVHESDGAELCVVCEDDVELKGAVMLHERVFYYVRSAPSNWQILQLHVIAPANRRPSSNSLLRFERWTPNHYSTLIYVVRRDGAERLLRKARESRPTPRTKWIADHYLYNNAITYSLDIPFFNDRTSLGSSIHESNLPMHRANHERIERDLLAASRRYPFV